MIMRQPLELIEVLEEYDVVATVAGGGHAAQAEAVRTASPAPCLLADPSAARR
jgi:small subunit ribosomal protein S9